MKENVLSCLYLIFLSSKFALLFHVTEIISNVKKIWHFMQIICSCDDKSTELNHFCDEGPVRCDTAGDFHSLTHTSAPTCARMYTERRFHVHSALMKHVSHPTSTYTWYYWHTLTQTISHTHWLTSGSLPWGWGENEMRARLSFMCDVRASLPASSFGSWCISFTQEMAVAPARPSYSFHPQIPADIYCCPPHTAGVWELQPSRVCLWPDRGNLQYGSWPAESHPTAQTDSSRSIPSVSVHTLQWVFHSCCN